MDQREIEICKQQSEIEYISVKIFILASKMYEPQLWAVCGRLWTNLRCVRSLKIWMPSPNSLALIVSEISAFIRIDRRTWLGEYMYFMESETLLIPVTYFPTLRVTGIKTKKKSCRSIFRYLTRPTFLNF